MRREIVGGKARERFRRFLGEFQMFLLQGGASKSRSKDQEQELGKTHRFGKEPGIA